VDRRNGSGLLAQVGWVVAAGVAVAVLAASFLVLVGGGRWLVGEPECTVRAGGRTVGLSTEEAQRAASVAARAVRHRVPLRAASVRVARAADVSAGDGVAVAAALTGRAPHALSCRHGGSDDAEPDRLDGSGLTGRAEAVRRDVERAFGHQQLGGYAPGGVSSGHMRGSAHYEGRAVDVFFRPVDARHRTRGWATAQYLVAQAERLEIDTVIFDGRIWTARRSAEGWRQYRPDVAGRPRQVAAVLEHRDHVHVDVAD
jgi:hypothetical protein